MKRSLLLALIAFLSLVTVIVAGFSWEKVPFARYFEIAEEVQLPHLNEDVRLVSNTDYGKVLSSRDDIVQGAVVDKIVLFAPESSCSSRIIERNAILVRYPDAEATIVVSHGFMCNKFDVTFLRNLFPKNKFNVLTFDYRAHGEKKEGQLCTFGKNEIYDLMTAARFIKNYEKTSGKPIYAYGFSMGAATALLAQSKEQDLFNAMVLDCPYDSTENIIKKGIDNLRFSVCGYEFYLPGNGLLKRYAFHPYVQSLIKTLLKSIAQIDSSAVNTCIHAVNPSQAAKSITIPCFFIHCKNDDRIPVDAVKRIYNNYGGIKKLWITNGRRHYDSYLYNPEMYTKRVRRFLDLVHRNELEKHYKKKIIEDKEDTFFQSDEL